MTRPVKKTKLYSINVTKGRKRNFNNVIGPGVFIKSKKDNKVAEANSIITTILSLLGNCFILFQSKSIINQMQS